MRDAITRELRIAFSLKAQPLWFRACKWAMIIAITSLLWGKSYLWWWLGGGLALGLSFHCLYRWKTHSWTRAWGGWNDVETAERNPTAKIDET